MPKASIAPILVPPFMGDGMSARAPKMIAKVADYTCTLADSGSVFHTTGATAAVNFTLPAISDGPFRFLFINGADQNMTVTAATADTAVSMNDLAADSVAFSTSSEKIGGAIEVWCDGVTLFILGRPCTTLQHVTIAS